MPSLKEYIWGGNKLKSEYNKKSTFEYIAESWELSCHKNGNSVIQNGEFANITLFEYITLKGEKCLGSNCENFLEFPLMVKLIDAKENLSVQVHPSNEYAQRVEGENGKTEMWYILDCNENSSIYCGLNHEISKEEFSKRIENNTILEVLNSIQVKKGDVFFIEAGTIHAIGAGIVIVEIQQNSNTTYRIYDYNRTDENGKQRKLHIQKAIDVANLSLNLKNISPKNKTEFCEQYKKTLLCSCDYFTVHLLEICGTVKLFVKEKSFVSILALDDNILLQSPLGNLNINKGDTIFLDAGFGEYTLLKTGKILLITV